MIQIQFTYFPGYKPRHISQGWRHLPIHHCTMSDSAVLDLGNSDDDPIMEMIDWAIDEHPDVFDVASDNSDYEAANDLAVSLAGEVIMLSEDVIDNKNCIRGKGGCWSERYRDMTLVDGVIIRVAYFV